MPRLRVRVPREFQERRAFFHLLLAPLRDGIGVNQPPLQLGQPLILPCGLRGLSSRVLLRLAELRVRGRQLVRAHLRRLHDRQELALAARERRLVLLRDLAHEEVQLRLEVVEHACRALLRVEQLRQSQTACTRGTHAPKKKRTENRSVERHIERA